MNGDADQSGQPGGRRGRSRRLLALATGAALGLAAAGVAVAQTVSADSVRGKARPDFAALGIESGQLLGLHHNGEAPGGLLDSFLVYPVFETAATYDSNVFRVDDGDAQGDFITDLRPSLRVESDWDNHFFAVEANGTARRHASLTNEDTTTWTLSNDGQIDLNEWTDLLTFLSFDSNTTQRGTLLDPGLTSSPTRFYTTTAKTALTYQRDALLLRLAFDVVRTNFENNGAVTNADLDRTERFAELRAAYDLVDGLQVFVAPGYKTVRYDRQFDGGGVERDSDTLRVETGVVWEATGVAELRLRLGWFSRDSHGAIFRDATGFRVGGDLLWNLSEITTLSASLDQEIAEEALRRASSISRVDRTSVRVSLDHEPLDDVIMTGRTAIVFDEFIGANQSQRTLTVGGDVTYYVNERWLLELTAERGKRTTEGGGTPYVYDLLSAALRYRI
ncbi:MAG: outer membrane beta-barrel protein [Alphaproteobacteria bacterium]